MRYALINAALLAAAVNAISVTAPTKDEQVELTSQSYTVTWTTVGSDPSSAHLFLVNQAGGHTPYSKDLGAIDLTKGSYTVAAIPGLTLEDGYQFNIQSVEQENTGILAQSPQFDVVAGSSSPSSSSTTTSSSTSSTTTPPTPTPTPGGSKATTSSSSSTTMPTVSSSHTGSGSANATSTPTPASGANAISGISMLSLAVVGAAALLI